MTNRKKRRRPPAGPPAARSQQVAKPRSGQAGKTSLRAPAPTGRSSTSDRGRSKISDRRRPSQKARTSRAKVEEPALTVDAPSVGLSVAKGLGVVGSSPLLLIVAFVSVLMLWVSLVGSGVGVGASPSAMVQLLGVPPIHSVIDLQLLQLLGVARAGGLVVGAFAIGLLVFRTAFASFVITVIADSFGGPRPWRERASAGLQSIASTFVVVLAMELAYMMLSLLLLSILPAVLGVQFFILGFVVLLYGGLYLLVYAEIVAVLERVRLREAVQLATRGARVPRSGQGFAVLPYVLLAFLVPNFTPGGSLAQATPSISVWVYVLVVNYVHVAALAAFVYRWQRIGDAVKAGAGPAPRAAGRRPSLFQSLRGGT